MSKQIEQNPQPKIRNIVVSIVITPDGDELVADASVSVNGKPNENVQVGLVLAGELDLSVTSGLETLTQMRAVANGAVALAEGLRERAFSHLEMAVVQALKAQEPAETPPAPADDQQESVGDSLVT